MEHKQARILLQKINQLFDAITSSEVPASRIEVDLLHDYTRQFYSCLGETARTDTKPSGQSTSVPDRPVAPVEQPVEPDEVKQAAVAEPEPIAEPAVLPAEVVLEPTQMDEAPTPISQRTPEPTLSPITHRAEYQVLFMAEEAKDLSDRLRTSPIDDLSRAMGINERFLTINELFQGNHEEFDQVLRRLNNLSSFEDARVYLEEEVIPKYDWMDKMRAKKAEIFIRLVRRRYL